MVGEPMVFGGRKKYLYRELIVELEPRKYKASGQAYKVVGY